MPRGSLDLKEIYWDRLIAAGIQDPEGFHHEFVRGGHGRKLDMEIVLNRRLSFNYLLGLVLKGSIVARHTQGDRIAVVGIANGMTTHAHDLSHYMAWRYPRLQVTAFETEKFISADKKIIQLTNLSHYVFKRNKFDVAVLDDDIGTTGSSTAQPVIPLRDYGISQIFAAYNVLRNNRLPELDALDVPVHSIVTKPQPTYSPLECAQVGFCSQGWELAKYGASDTNIV